MIRFKSLVAAVLVGLLPLCFAQVSSAQGEEEGHHFDMDADEWEEEEEAAPEPTPQPAGEQPKGDDKGMDFGEEFDFDVEVDDEEENEDGEGGGVAELASPFEKKNETYTFLGMRYRGIFIPQAMMNLFGDGGTNVYVNSVGPELGIRKNDEEFIFSAWYADYSMDQVPFKGASDPEDAWEVVEANLNVVYLTMDILWTSKLTSDLALVYGFGGGLGVVWGDLFRQQAYPVEGGYTVCTNSDDPRGNIPVPGVGTRDYCDNDNNHYGDYSEPSWFSGGSKPNIFPWLAGQGGIRYRPVEPLAIRLDLGLGLSGPFFGLAAGWSL